MEDADLIAYAGSDYASPKKVVAGEITLSDSLDVGLGGIDQLIIDLSDFRARYSGMEFGPVEHYLDEAWDYPLIGFQAIRMETSEEIAARVAGYQQAILRRKAERLAQYKREFGDI